MDYMEGVTICSNVIEGLRAEIELDESRAQELWDGAACRRQALEDLERALGVIRQPPTQDKYWAFEPRTCAADPRKLGEKGHDVPTKEGGKA